jgi:hypothetical protein
MDIRAFCLGIRSPGWSCTRNGIIRAVPRTMGCGGQSSAGSTTILRGEPGINRSLTAHGSPAGLGAAAAATTRTTVSGPLGGSTHRTVGVAAPLA